MSEIIGCDKPDWDALETFMTKTIGIDNCKDFMYMGCVVVGEIWIYLYKHYYTRRFLNIDGKGCAYRFDAGGYSPITDRSALEHALN